MKNVARIQLSFLFIFFALLAVNAQMINIPFDIDNWEIQDEQKPVFEEYMGKESISFSKGVILAKEVNFLNGIIEVDINFPEKRGFPGLVFRVEDLSNYEEFYIRPHQSGNPDANQYTPVFNGLAGWQLYYGEGHSKAIAYEFGAWNHLKIEIKGQKAFVYLNDMEKPLLEIPELKRDLKAGKIGLKAFMAPVHFANFRYQKTDATTSAEAIKKADGENQNEVRNWNVSDAFSAEDFDNDVFLPEKFTADLNWKTVKSETSGLINFARFCQYSRAKNTAIASFELHSEIDQIKQLWFGYSDIVNIYVNGQLIYSGKNTYRSRDYRYLGTIGYFDSIYMPLKTGKNTIIFVVTENFGGWGIKAKLTNLEGVQLKK